MEKRKAIVLGGQTASGKSSLALSACIAFGGEIISADSMQVYRKMDIGTAKPSHDDRLAVKHHLIDILDINERFSSADFVSLASDSLEDIHSREKIPFIVGGTGLYSEMLFNSFTLDESRGCSDIRNELMNESREKGFHALYEELSRIDPVAASKTHENNIRRVIRYLEIYRTTGKTPTEMNEINNSGEKLYDPLYICLFSQNRDFIYSRINSRVDIMMEDGLENEVRSLWMNGLENTPTSSAAIGYKEFFPYFRGEYGLNDAVESIKQHSRNYAKRQHTYFKRMNNITMIDIADECWYDAVTELINDYLKK